MSNEYQLRFKFDVKFPMNRIFAAGMNLSLIPYDLFVVMTFLYDPGS